MSKAKHYVVTKSHWLHGDSKEEKRFPVNTAGTEDMYKYMHKCAAEGWAVTMLIK